MAHVGSKVSIAGIDSAYTVEATSRTTILGYKSRGNQCLLHQAWHTQSDNSHQRFDQKRPNNHECECVVQRESRQADRGHLPERLPGDHRPSARRPTGGEPAGRGEEVAGEGDPLQHSQWQAQSSQVTVLYIRADCTGADQGECSRGVHARLVHRVAAGLLSHCR